MKADLAKRDPMKYCEYHRDHDHHTDDCIQLKKEIEFFIQMGQLRRFVAHDNQNRAPLPPAPQLQAPTQQQQPLGEIRVISRGFAGGGESNSARKAHLRRIRADEKMEIHTVSKTPRLDIPIIFSDSDLEGCQHPHDDPLVVRPAVSNRTVYRVLIDNGSSADIFFSSAFDQMGISREKLEPISAHLMGFAGEKVLPLGSI